MSFSRFKASAAMALCATLSGVATSAWADPLSIEPSTGVFTVVPGSEDSWPSLAGGMSQIFRGLNLTDTGLTSEVTGVSVVGQGPGPVRVSFGNISGAYDIHGGERGELTLTLLLDDVAFDVGTKSLTGDVTVRTYNTCVGGPDIACAAWFSMDRKFDDLSLLKSDQVLGSIDGGMPLDQAVVLQTFKPQRLDLSADLYLDLSGMRTVLEAMHPGSVIEISGEDGPKLVVGNLTVTSAVPELSSGSMMVLGLGLFGLAGVARRRQSRA